MSNREVPALLLEAGTAGLLACTAAGQYPRTRPVFACYHLQKKFLYALIDLEVFLVKSGANTHLSRDILFSTFYTGLLLLFRTKTGGARVPPAPPLATALLCH